MKKVLIHTTWGPTDPTRAGLAFTYAKVAKQNDCEVSIFLFHDAVSLARKEMSSKVIPVGPPLLQDCIDYLLEQEVKIYVCEPCFRQRGMQEAERMPNTELSGMGKFFELSKDHDVVTF